MTSRSWVLHAAASAIFAGLTAFLAKIGVSQVPSNVATLVRTVVVVVFAAGIVAASGQLHHLQSITGRGWLALVSSGVATGLSWLFYFAALKQGPVSGVAPIDKLSFVIAMILGFVVLKRNRPAPDPRRRRPDRGRGLAHLAGVQQCLRTYGHLEGASDDSTPVRRRRGGARSIVSASSSGRWLPIKSLCRRRARGGRRGCRGRSELARRRGRLGCPSRRGRRSGDTAQRMALTFEIATARR